MTCKHYNNKLYMLECDLWRICKHRALIKIGQVTCIQPHCTAMSMTSKVAMVTDHPSITKPYTGGEGECVWKNILSLYKWHSQYIKVEYHANAKYENPYQNSEKIACIGQRSMYSIMGKK